MRKKVLEQLLYMPKVKKKGGGGGGYKTEIPEEDQEEITEENEINLDTNQEEQNG